MVSCKIVAKIARLDSIRILYERKNELPGDITNKMTVRPANTQISLGISA